MNEIGNTGQSKLSNTKVVIVGCGGLGSIVAPYLAGAGVSHLVLVDGDIPDITNLHRQVFYHENEERKKSSALSEHIKKINSSIRVSVYEEMLNKSNIQNIFDGADLVLECSDDIFTKYLVNDYCHIHNLPMVYGAIYKFDGYVSLFENKNDQSIHLRDIFPEPDVSVPSCSEVGVVNTIAGIIGLLQANEALKYIIGMGSGLIGQLLTYNVLENQQFNMKLKKSWQGNLKSLYKEMTYAGFSCESGSEITIEDLSNRRDEYLVISILEKFEHKAIDSNIEHIPLSVLPSMVMQLPKKKTVFYCLSGKRSMALVNQLKEISSEVEYFSLKGGLKEAQMYLSKV